MLSRHFLAGYKVKLRKDVVDFTQQALELLSSYSWPGNVRELENAVEYAVNIESTSYIRETSLPRRVREHPVQKRSLKDKVRQYEINEITEALNRYGWGAKGKETAARELEISLPSLYRKLMEPENEQRGIMIQAPKPDNEKPAKKKDPKSQ